MYKAKETNTIYRGLKNRFLYDNDLNSIYVLLALYDLEEDINSIHPRYISLSDIKQSVKEILSKRKDIDNIVHNLSVILHEDINRLELCFYLEGYKDGHRNLRLANILEYEIIKLYGIGFTYKKENLRYILNDKNFCELKESFARIMRVNFENQNYMNSLADKFIKVITMNKVKNLEKYLEEQLNLMTDFNEFRRKFSDFKLSYSEINTIEEYIYSEIKPHLNKLYEDSLWAAVNDRVFNRYK
ncbi:MAG: hypothetical protein Q4P31_00020 [Andreesenia angusta]|nr:hypothetical protein [Andreesenia angusta]